ncbi:hypothetical protein [Kitasatospora sp. GP82]|uniref:hypothetical protein n=1 Tax=Kitasatospora sp. GP82 TaxID=3035089 RepID=UPI002474A027|nr:hypothetical protein [Kitasatospora sp. GP82]MDH6126592.1 hypothetical protein [Kitasatospora sp. GP82]
MPSSPEPDRPEPDDAVPGVRPRSRPCSAFQAGRGVWSLGAGQRLQVLLVALWPAVLARSVRASASSSPAVRRTDDQA